MIILNVNDCGKNNNTVAYCERELQYKVSALILIQSVVIIDHPHFFLKVGH